MVSNSQEQTEESLKKDTDQKGGQMRHAAGDTETSCKPDTLAAGG